MCRHVLWENVEFHICSSGDVCSYHWDLESSSGDVCSYHWDLECSAGDVCSYHWDLECSAVDCVITTGI